MLDLVFRTEDIKSDDLLDLYVPTKRDREIVSALKAQNPILLEGSRGVGKSYLLRVAEAKLKQRLRSDRILPVYVLLNKASLVRTTTPKQFRHWTLAKVISRLLRTLRKTGLVDSIRPGVSILPHSSVDSEKVDAIVEDFEQSWKTQGSKIDVSELPHLDRFKDQIEDLCDELDLDRINIFFDEAAHILLPEQQRQFFTLFRDLRSPYISCNAAIYPGVTAFGNSFQPSHDASLIEVERDIRGDNYVPNMKEIVSRQADASLESVLTTRGENFATLAYAASGNPRILLKTVSSAKKLRRKDVQRVLREYYRTSLWAEHTQLGEDYEGYQQLVDWGRNFIEDIVLPNLASKNMSALKENEDTTCYFWIQKDAPRAVNQAIQLLMYTGVVRVHTEGIKVTHGWVGTRYAVNLGSLFSEQGGATGDLFKTAKSLSVEKVAHFNRHHSEFDPLVDEIGDFSKPDLSPALEAQLKRPVDVLDVTSWQLSKLKSELSYKTVGDVLEATEHDIQDAWYVGPVRARQMRNAAEAAVLEYLSG